MLDIYAAIQAYTDRIMSNNGLVCTTFNVADGLTKKMCQNELLNVLISGRKDPVAEKWIIPVTVQATPLVNNEVKFRYGRRVTLASS